MLDNSGFFQGVAHGFLKGGNTVVKFPFTNSKLREKFFFY